MHSSVNASTFSPGSWVGTTGRTSDLFLVQKHGTLHSLIFAAGVLLKFDGYVVGKRLLLFYLPFTLCFIIPNFVKMAPWNLGHIKVLYYWWLASAPLVACCWRGCGGRANSCVARVDCFSSRYVAAPGRRGHRIPRTKYASSMRRRAISPSASKDNQPRALIFMRRCKTRRFF
jgi:hypothetical protein